MKTQKDSTEMDGMKTQYVLVLLMLVQHLATDFVYARPGMKNNMLTGSKAYIGDGSSCLVTANLLYSHGYFVREITPAEETELHEYERELESYNQEMAEFLRAAYIKNPPTINWLYGSRVVLPGIQHAMPKRPSLPSFCNARDTVMYKLNGCTVQNYRLYIGSLYVRQLDDEERRQMDEFEYKLREYESQVAETLANRPRAWQPMIAPPEGFWITTAAADAAGEPCEDSKTDSTSSSPTGAGAVAGAGKLRKATPPAPPKFCSLLF